MSMESKLLDEVGNVRGHFKTKENRAAKLIAVWDDLESKFEDMIVRGNGETETARLAYACLTMMETGIRVGNEGSAEGFVCENKYHEMFGKEVQTFGLTTLLKKHVSVSRKKLEISFTGKKLVEQNLVIVRKSLIEFAPETDDETWLGIDYNGFKKFVKRYVGRNFSPKDIRTAKVNKLFVERFVADTLAKYIEASRKSDRKRLLSETIEATAEVIGHTKSVCKSAYLSSPLLRLIADAEFNQKGWKL